MVNVPEITGANGFEGNLKLPVIVLPVIVPTRISSDSLPNGKENMLPATTDSPSLFVSP